jgi:hypothetical protein
MSTDNESPIILTAAEQEGLGLPDDFGDEIITSDNEGHDDFAMDDDDEEIEITIDDDGEEVAPVIAPVVPESVVEPVVENTGIDYAEVLLASTTKQAELEAQLKDLATKFDDGELDDADYNIEVRKIERAIARVEAKMELAEEQIEAQNAAAEANQAKLMAQWEKAQVDFFAKPENKAIAEDDAMLNSLDAHVKKILAAGNVPIADVLDLAKHNLLAGIAKLTGQKAPDAPKPSTKPKAPQVELPPTLGNIPSAIPNADGDEFGYIDKLSGRKYEDAVAKLTPEQHDRYLLGTK